MSALNRDLGRGELRAALREAEARIAVVLALHAPQDDPPFCAECSDSGLDAVADWPCPTVRALQGEA